MIVLYFMVFIVIVIVALFVIERFFPKLAEKIITFFDGD